MLPWEFLAQHLGNFRKTRLTIHMTSLTCAVCGSHIISKMSS